MASQNNNNNNNNNNIFQKPLNQKQIALLLFREELQNLTGESYFEGSQEEIDAFNEVFLRNDPLLFEQSQIKLQNNMAMCLIVELSCQRLSCYNICCILPDKKEGSHDKTGTSIDTGTKEISQDKTGISIGTNEVFHDKTGTSNGTGTKELFHDKTGTGTKEVFQDKTGTSAGTKENSHDKTGTGIGTGTKEICQNKTGTKENKTGTGTKEIYYNKTGAGVKEVFLHITGISTGTKEISLDKTGTVTGTGTKEVFQDKTGTVPAEPASSSPSQIELETVNQNPKTEPPKPLNPKSVPKNANSSVPVPVKEPVPSLKDLCTDLRANANCLLTDSGYKLELRKRNDKNIFDSIYHLPNNKGVSANLPKTWVSLGNLLISSCAGTSIGTAGREWVGIEEFKSDLKNTLFFIENTMKNNNNSELSLLDRWFLLDPFVAVTFIDRKISALRKGAKIKAIYSKTSVISQNEIIDLKNKNDNQCETTHLPLVASQSESQSGKEAQNPVNLHENTIFQKLVLRQNAVFPKPVLIQNTLSQNPVLSQNTIFQKPVLSPNAIFQNPVLSQNTVFKEPVPSLKDLCTDLRANANRLLDDCGYKLELKKKKDRKRNYVVPCYRWPNNKGVLANLPKTWVSLGDFLKSDHTGTGTAGKQWVGIEEFKSDLKNMLTFIENMMKNNMNSNYELSLLDRWFLLDPFVAVTYIDKRILALKKGAKIKAIHSKAFDVCGNETTDLNNKNVDQCEKTLLPLVIPQLQSRSGKEVQNAVNLHENSVLNSKTSVISENEMIDLKNKNADTCENTLLPLQSESWSGKEAQNAINLHENEIPIGSTFKINQVSQNTVFQKLDLVLYPFDVPISLDCNGQITVNEMGNGIPVFDPSFFEGTLAFDRTSGFEMKESFISWVIYNHQNSKSKFNKSKNKRKLIPDSNENNPHKRSKKITDTSGNKRICRFNGQDLLISAIIIKKASKYLKNPKIRYFNNQTVKILSKKKRFSQGLRTVLNLLINRNLVSVNCKIFYKKSNLVKHGKLTRNGVLCECCNDYFSVSGFNRHTDFDVKHRDFDAECTDVGAKFGNLMNLFVGFGKPYLICLFNAWALEYKEMRERVMIMKGRERESESEGNDDACGLCADVGELVCCDSCPSSFHESCLPDQHISEECWNCPRCMCEICGDFVDKSMEISSSKGFFECFQCGNKYHEKCVKDGIVLNEDGPSKTWFCENLCGQVYTYMRAQIGKSIHISDTLHFTILKCNHEERNIKTLNSENLARLAQNNVKLAVACKLMEECFDKITDSRTGLDLIPLVLYNWRLEIVNLDCANFYTVVLERDDRIISVASIRLHGTKAAEMPLIATCIENRRQGMCQRLVSAIQQMLKSLNVETLLLSSVPDLVETWISRFGFVPIEKTDKEKLCKTNLLTVPGTVLLRKDLSQVSVELQG